MAFKNLKDKFTKSLSKNNITEGVQDTKEDKEDVNVEVEQFSNHNKNMLSSVLDIKEKTELNNVITTDDIRKVSFTLVAPTGYDPKEVSRFINSIKSDINNYQKAIKQRDEDVSKLYNELSRVENQLQETQQKSELAAFMNEKQNKVDELKDQLADLRMENMELKEKIEKLKKSNFTDLEKPENNPLPKINELPPLDNNKNVLPDLEDDNADIVSDVDILNDTNKEDDTFLSMLDELDLE
jgi:divIVA domain